VQAAALSKKYFDLWLCKARKKEKFCPPKTLSSFTPTNQHISHILDKRVDRS
jgi:hypothetical protein